MAKTSADPIECARRGDVNYFRALNINDLEKSRTDEGDSVLSEAAIENHLECCKEICRRSPSLVYHQNEYGRTALHIGRTALHIAAWKGRSEIVELLLYADYYTKSQDDIESGAGGEKIPNKKLLLMVDGRRRTALHIAASHCNTETARILIKADPSHELLGMKDVSKRTALHVAVAVQDFEMVKLLVNHKPDFVYYADYRGETPLMIAMALAQFGDKNSAYIRKFLMQKQASQIKFRTGDHGTTLLHDAAIRGDLDAVKDIIQFCPDCLEMTDNQGKNFLHLAAMREHVNIVEHALQIPNISKNVLNAQDHYEDTPLHIAAKRGNAKVAECLLYDQRVLKTIKNEKGKTAVELINFDYDKKKAGVPREIGVVNEKVLKEKSDFDLVVCALIATVSFTAGMTVPGGYINDGPNQGMAVLSMKKAFEVFIIANTCALLLSLSAVFSHLSTRLMHEWKDVDFQVKLATYCTLGAIFTMMVTFITGSYAVLAISKGLAITVCILSGSFFILVSYAICKVAMQYKNSTSTEQQTPTP